MVLVVMVQLVIHVIVIFHILDKIVKPPETVKTRFNVFMVIAYRVQPIFNVIVRLDILEIHVIPISMTVVLILVTMVVFVLMESIVFNVIVRLDILETRVIPISMTVILILVSMVVVRIKLMDISVSVLPGGVEPIVMYILIAMEMVFMMTLMLVPKLSKENLLNPMVVRLNKPVLVTF